MRTRYLILAALLLLSPALWAQHTTVTAQVLDPTGALYSNCSGSATFVGQNTTPGAGPYTLGGGTFQTSLPLQCDSSANFTLSLADNNAITPTPSQWRFTICAPTNLSNGPPPFCFNALITITGLTQTITAQLQSVAAVLPSIGGGTTVAGTPNQINVATAGHPPVSTLSFANPAVFPGGGQFNGAVSVNSGLGALELIPDPLGLCTYSGFGTQDQLCNLGGQLVWNQQGVGGANQLVLYGKYYDLINSPPANGSLWFFNSVTGQLELLTGNAAGIKMLQEDASGNLSWVAVTGAPTAALPASPLINQGASTSPVYAAGVTYATTAQNWSESKTTTLTGGSASSLTLAAGHSGIDVTTGYGYQVYISDGGNSEAVAVTGGTYTFGAGGTITFTPFFNHGPGVYTVGSASSGIQETFNAACSSGATTLTNNYCNVTVPSNGPGFPTGAYNTYAVQGTIFLHSARSSLSGYGVHLECSGRSRCVQVGDLLNSNHFVDITLAGFGFRTPTDFSTTPAYAGVQITNTVRTSNVITITTATAHGFRIGDMVTIMFTDNSSYWGDAVVTGVPTSTTFTYTHATSSDITTAASSGVVALTYVAILDNAGNSHFKDISSDYTGMNGKFNNFFDFWDDENASIDHFNNNAGSMNTSINWSGSYVFSGGARNLPSAAQQLAPVISIRDSTFTANDSNCVTVFNSNSIYVDNTVCQASGLWQVYSSNDTGNFQGAALRNIYPESTVNANPFGTITGSVTSGVCQIGDKYTQAVTGAVLYGENAPTGAQSLTVTAVNGTPDNSHTWTATTSLCVYTPTAVPVGYRSPFPGMGIGGLIAGTSTGAASFSISGNGNVQGTYRSNGLGATAISYWIVVNDTTAGTHSSPMRVLDWLSTGTDLIPVQWPRVANGTDTITYDVIRSGTPSSTVPVPYNGGCTGGTGTTCGSVATALSQAVACSGLVCTFQDTASSTTASYTINPGTYTGTIFFWPGAITSSQSTVSVSSEIAPVAGMGLNGNPIQSAQRCGAQGVASAGGYTACLASVTTLNNSVTNQTATLMTDGAFSGGTPTLSKGRLNIITTAGAGLGKHHFITLFDSQPDLTKATLGYRPLASANDVWIGMDGGSSLTNVQLAFGSPVSISNYIADTGSSGTTWLERLTSTAKTFTIPIDMKAIAAPGNPASGFCRMYVDSGTGLTTFLTSAGANCFGGAVTGSATAGQGAFWTASATLAGMTDFLVNNGATHQVTVPLGASATSAGLLFGASGNFGFGASAAGQSIELFGYNGAAQSARLNFYAWGGASYSNTFNIFAGSANTTFATAAATNQPVSLGGSLGTTINLASVYLGNSSSASSSTATSGTQAGVALGAGGAGSVGVLTFAPTSGTANFHGLFVNPTINQTGGANGTSRIIAAYPLNTAVVGTEYLLAAGTAGSAAVNATLTDIYTVDSSGNEVVTGLHGETTKKGPSYCETAGGPTTLSTVATTTTTGLSCLPANSMIDAVVARVTTTITGACTGWELGDGTTAARFSTNNTGLTSGTTTDAAHIGTFNNTGIASATTGMWQAAAGTITITCAGGNPTAGAIRITVFYHTWTPPTS